MKKSVSFIFGFIIIIILLITAFALSSVFFDENKVNKTICENAGGSWEMFSNGCGDACGTKDSLCTMAFQEGCDCGVNMCWDGIKCILGESGRD